MKTDISIDKLIEVFKAKQKYIFIFFVIVFILGMGLATYFALVPGADKNVSQQAMTKKQELNINFDKKSLQELNNKKSPAVINEAGGRNPFMPY